MALADTAGTAVIIGYETLMRHYRTLRPRDSIAAATGPMDVRVLVLEGLVVDETRSRLARQFYDLFYRQWEAPEGTAGHTVKVTERPAPGLGTVVIVRVDDEPVYGIRLQPRYAEIKRAARAAVYYARRHLQRQAGSLFDY